MRVLLHMCCAPCTIYPLSVLRKEGHEVCGLFENPNIHPYQEYERRAETLLAYSRQMSFNVLWSQEYGMEEFLRNVAYRERERCYYCYYERLKATVTIAKREKFQGFTTSLFYSKFQKHDLLKRIAGNLAEEYGVELIYFDFRKGWKEGIRISRELGMYRQAYCGCIYSEKERFYSPDFGRQQIKATDKRR